MNERTHALLRLYALQGAWTYERMLGIGMGYAAEPLLADLGLVNPARLAEARVRAADFFNCHPHLAGLALGAQVRAEFDGVPGTQIGRLRTALGGPLGALGDQFFWAGLVPLLAGVALMLTALGLPIVGVGALLLGYNAVRWQTGRWALRTGLSTGLGVGGAISGSWLPKAAAAIGPWAGLTVGLALPLTGVWLLHGQPLVRGGAAAVLALAVAALAWVTKYRLSPVRVALGLTAGVLLYRLGRP